MGTMTKQFITAITKQTEYLTLNFDQPWFQEDIEELYQQVFSALIQVNIQGKITGADRENIRFSWQGHYFVLNFDCCSQSCWLEGQDNESTAQIEHLYVALVK